MYWKKQKLQRIHQQAIEPENVDFIGALQELAIKELSEMSQMMRGNTKVKEFKSEIDEVLNQYYGPDGDQQNPIPDEQLDQLITELGADSRVNKDFSANLVELDNFKEAMDVFQENSIVRGETNEPYVEYKIQVGDNPHHIYLKSGDENIGKYEEAITQIVQNNNMGGSDLSSKGYKIFQNENQPIKPIPLSDYGADRIASIEYQLKDNGFDKSLEIFQSLKDGVINDPAPVEKREMAEKILVNYGTMMVSGQQGDAAGQRGDLFRDIDITGDLAGVQSKLYEIKDALKGSLVGTNVPLSVDNYYRVNAKLEPAELSEKIVENGLTQYVFKITSETDRDRILSSSNETPQQESRFSELEEIETNLAGRAYSGIRLNINLQTFQQLKNDFEENPPSNEQEHNIAERIIIDFGNELIAGKDGGKDYFEGIKLDLTRSPQNKGDFSKKVNEVRDAVLNNHINPQMESGGFYQENANLKSNNQNLNPEIALGNIIANGISSYNQALEDKRTKPGADIGDGSPVYKPNKSDKEWTKEEIEAARRGNRTYPTSGKLFDRISTNDTPSQRVKNEVLKRSENPEVQNFERSTDYLREQINKLSSGTKYIFLKKMFDTENQFLDKKEREINGEKLSPIEAEHQNNLKEIDERVLGKRDKVSIKKYWKEFGEEMERYEEAIDAVEITKLPRTFNSSDISEMFDLPKMEQQQILDAVTDNINRIKKGLQPNLSDAGSNIIESLKDIKISDEQINNLINSSISDNDINEALQRGIQTDLILEGDITVNLTSVDISDQEFNEKIYEIENIYRKEAVNARGKGESEKADDYELAANYINDVQTLANNNDTKNLSTSERRRTIIDVTGFAMEYTATGEHNNAANGYQSMKESGRYGFDEGTTQKINQMIDESGQIAEKRVASPRQDQGQKKESNAFIDLKGAFPEIPSSKPDQEPSNNVTDDTPSAGEANKPIIDLTGDSPYGKGSFAERGFKEKSSNNPVAVSVFKQMAKMEGINVNFLVLDGNTRQLTTSDEDFRSQITDIQNIYESEVTNRIPEELEHGVNPIRNHFQISAKFIENIMSEMPADRELSPEEREALMRVTTLTTKDLAAGDKSEEAVRRVAKGINSLEAEAFDSGLIMKAFKDAVNDSNLLAQEESKNAEIESKTSGPKGTATVEMNDNGEMNEYEKKILKEVVDRIQNGKGLDGKKGISQSEGNVLGSLRKVLGEVDIEVSDTPKNIREEFGELSPSSFSGLSSKEQNALEDAISDVQSSVKKPSQGRQ